jgi:hypothetical protein
MKSSNTNFQKIIKNKAYSSESDSKKNKSKNWERVNKRVMWEN